jgi:hypothetical protein
MIRLNSISASSFPKECEAQPAHPEPNRRISPDLAVHALQYGRFAPQRAPPPCLRAQHERSAVPLGSRPKPHADQTPSHFFISSAAVYLNKKGAAARGRRGPKPHSAYARNLQHVDYTERKTTCKAPKRQYFLLFFVPFVKILALSPRDMLH